MPNLAAPQTRAEQQIQQPWWTQFGLMLKLQYTDYRASAVILAAFSIVMPLGLFWILNQYVAVGTEAVWLLAGNMVLSISYGSVNFAIQRVGWIKLQGEIDYYATMPIHRSAFVGAIFVLGLLSALPGLLASMIIGSLMLKVPFSGVVWALPLGLLAAASLTVVGAAVGGLARSMSQVGLWSSMVYLVVTFLCPVLLPTEKLPLPLKVTTYLLPPGQAAIALTDALSGVFGPRFWLTTGALCLWLLLASLVGVGRLDWRSK